VPQSPHRPFVPHRTPEATRASLAPPEFRLSRPFVPGTERKDVAYAVTAAPDATIVAGLAASREAVEPQLPPIEDFVDTRGEFVDERAQVLFDNRGDVESLEYGEELPPVEHFVDPLPDVSAFAPDSRQSLSSFEETPSTERASLPGAGEVAEADWVETDWQQFDWRSVAALGESESAHVEASNAWARTDWDNRLPRPGAPRESAADAIARALDEIAQRIRSGELALPSPTVAPDPATIAATVAALLGARR
jgi:hypothetical protein